MKRASLAIAPVTRKDAAPDLTDRILARTPAAPARPKTARRPGARPAAKTPVRTAVPAPRAASPASRAATRRGPALPAASATVSLPKALASSQAAVEALTAAAHSSPARYDLALRYRLDSLAHHLRQVAEFVAAAGRAQETRRESE